MQPAFATPSTILLPFHSRRRPRPNTSPRAFSGDGQQSSRSQPPALLPKTTAPSPWVEAALLTLFEAAPEKVVPPPPPAPKPIPKWVAVWQSLAALYALRIRLTPRRVVPPPPTVYKPQQHSDSTSGKVVVVETPTFHQATGFDPARAVSRVVVCVADLLADAVVLEMVSRITRPADCFHIMLGVVAAYASADLVSTMYNWLRLNFSPNSAVFGEKDGGTVQSFSKLVAPHCAAVAPFFAIMLASPPGELAGDAFVCYFLTFVSLLPAFGEWCGSEKRVPWVIEMLQSAGVMVRRSSEASLHRLEYGLVCGVWDSFLKRLKLFSVLERWIYIHSGGRIRPKVWDIVPEARVRACGPNDELIKGIRR